MNIQTFLDQTPALKEVVALEPTVWINPDKEAGDQFWHDLDFDIEDIYDADERLRRFAPLLTQCFEDTRAYNGIIESPLKPLHHFETSLKEMSEFKGRLFLKMDSHLAVAGSIKARGGIYEVLYYAEQLALKHQLITTEDDYAILASPENRAFFSKYTIQVGSTGNLGLSIGIAAATLGFKVIVHMSNDAKQWKKDLLRSKGAIVKEYEGDFTSAVTQGRLESKRDPLSYFVDDENSLTLFLGYAVAALRLQEQFKQQNILVDKDHPLFVYLPCGVGGSPGGISYGLKKIFGEAVHLFFVEPTHAPSMLIGMATGLNGDISVQDFNIDGKTQADGLAVGTPSEFVGKVMKPVLSGIFTIEDRNLFNYMRLLNEKEHIQIEPSACATFEGPMKLFELKDCQDYLIKHQLTDKMDQATHLTWATGGKLVPQSIMNDYLTTYL